MKDRRIRYRLYQIVPENERFAHSEAAVKSFSGRAKLRAWVIEQRLAGNNAKFKWVPAFPFVKDAPLDFIMGTNIRKEATK